MRIGTKNRLLQTAEICKQHLREKYRDKLTLVEEFIEEFEGSGETADHTRWNQFADVRRLKAEMLERLDQHFENWLNPGA
ncbi:hypothetical protein ACXR0O_24685 [Verrucomicrobiota bacterium sgz303538]